MLRCTYRKKKKETKTHQWIDGLRDVDQAARALPRKTRVLCVMDREADVFALFAAQRSLRRTHVLVRARNNRNLGRDQALLFKAMRKRM